MNKKIPLLSAKINNLANNIFVSENSFTAYFKIALVFCALFALCSASIVGVFISLSEHMFLLAGIWLIAVTISTAFFIAAIAKFTDMN